MKTTILTFILALVALVGMGQSKPKQHVFYDTVKTVKERIEYAPDTIPVYFKEVAKIAYKCIGCGDTIVEKWHRGFVVWQTYIKYQRIIFSNTASYSDSTFFVHSGDLYKEPYEPSKSLLGLFLYENKTQCKNLVIYSIKR